MFESVSKTLADVSNQLGGDAMSKLLEEMHRPFSDLKETFAKFDVSPMLKGTCAPSDIADYTGKNRISELLGFKGYSTFLTAFYE